MDHLIANYVYYIGKTNFELANNTNSLNHFIYIFKLYFYHLKLLDDLMCVCLYIYIYFNTMNSSCLCDFY